jgi:hypothetical protein
VSEKYDVSYERPEIAMYWPDWETVDDTVAGSRQIKAKTVAYLPKPNPTDKTDENVKRYEQYVDRAAFFNATGRTLEGLVGIAFKRGVDLEVPASMEFTRTDIDGAGGGVNNQSHRVLEELLKKGRGGLLVDHPVSNQAISKAQQTSQNIHATITTYSAQSIINWRVDDQQNLTLIVLHEEIDEPDGFGIEQVEQWRELAMSTLSKDEGGKIRYVVRIWRKDTDTSDPVIVDEFIPKKAGGDEWKRIPFTFVGAVDNNPEVDKAPLLDLAVVNIAHYRNSADYEESAYFVGQPTFAASGLDEHWIEHAWPDEGVYVGSRALIPLPVGGSISLVQANPNTLAGEAMKGKEVQMVALGARLLTYGEAIKTAEQSRSETAAAHSVLSLAVANMALAYTQCLEWVREFTSNATGAISYRMPTDYTGLNTSNYLLITALVAAWQTGAISTQDKNQAFRQLGAIDPEKDDETIADEIDAEGGGLELDE